MSAMSASSSREVASSIDASESSAVGSCSSAGGLAIRVPKLSVVCFGSISADLGGLPRLFVVVSSEAEEFANFGVFAFEACLVAGDEFAFLLFVAFLVAFGVSLVADALEPVLRCSKLAQWGPAFRNLEELSCCRIDRMSVHLESQVG